MDQLETDRNITNAVSSSFDNPPEDQWALCEITDREGKVTDSFRVPFTSAELDLIKRANDARYQEDLRKGYINGGPERKHSLALSIPQRRGLADRKHALALIQRTVQNAERILAVGTYTPGLKSRDAIVSIKEALTPFMPPKQIK